MFARRDGLLDLPFVSSYLGLNSLRAYRYLIGQSSSADHERSQACNMTFADYKVWSMQVRLAT